MKSSDSAEQDLWLTDWHEYRMDQQTVVKRVTPANRRTALALAAVVLALAAAGCFQDEASLLARQVESSEAFVEFTPQEFGNNASMELLEELLRRAHGIDSGTASVQATEEQVRAVTRTVAAAWEQKYGRESYNLGVIKYREKFFALMVLTP